MKVKELIENLELENDLNLLTLDELKEKYLISGESYSYFIERYCNLFLNNPEFQSRTIPSFSNVRGMIEQGNRMYPTPENAHARNEISEKMNSIKFNDQLNNPEKARIEFLSLVRAKDNGLPGYYESVVDRACTASKLYESCDDSICDFMSTIYVQLDGVKSEDDLKKIVNDYIETHDLMKLCNNLGYLYFVNYVLSRLHPLEISPKFVRDCEDVIEVNKILGGIGYPTRRTYAVLANETKKYIDKYYRDYKSYKNKAVQEDVQKKVISFTSSGNK